MTTGATLALSLIGLAIVWSALEYKTLKDDIPGNHITATIRAGIKAQPGPFLLLAFNLGYLAGHLGWW